MAHEVRPPILLSPSPSVAEVEIPRIGEAAEVCSVCPGARYNATAATSIITRAQEQWAVPVITVIHRSALFKTLEAYYV